MSSPFARMTSSLLVRKGDAAPSVVDLPLRRAAPFGVVASAAPEPAPVNRPVVAPRQLSEGKRAGEPEKQHRIRVIVGAGDLQRIGIAAVKAGVTRQKIIHAALQAYLHEFAADLHQPCHCLTDETCQCGASDGWQTGNGQD